RYRCPAAPTSIRSEATSPRHARCVVEVRSTDRRALLEAGESTGVVAALHHEPVVETARAGAAERNTAAPLDPTVGAVDGLAGTVRCTHPGRLGLACACLEFTVHARRIRARALTLRATRLLALAHVADER